MMQTHNIPGGLYIHVPFCLQKCPYCDFYSVPVSDTMTDAYTEAVCRSLRALREPNRTVDTVYFGGGTPSLLSNRQIHEILDTAATCFSLAADAEITSEVNPATVSLKQLKQLRTFGINRLSVGIQSLQDEQLKTLGRLHTANEAVKTLEMAAEVGFENLSGDLMLALPNQTAASLEQTISEMITLPLTHISAYLLKIESHTPYAAQHMERQCPDDDQAAEFYLQTVDALEKAGFFQYEISNFAKPKWESRHNLKYWKCIDYLGIGPSAHSCWNDKRFFMPPSVSDFLAQDVPHIQWEDENPCTPEERLMLGMRLCEGVPFTWLDGKASLLQRYEKAGYLHRSDERIAFTSKGFLVSNRILSELI